ncbi:MAG: hypothetical protein JOY83_23650 [Alphaproteobacteria bacterium]|nr:hypothetical protein [Alphaproteobacteria bacterium]
MTLALYLAPFVILGLAMKRWMARKGVNLSDVRAEGNPHRRRSRFLLGIWRHEDPD